MLGRFKFHQALELDEFLFSEETMVSPFRIRETGWLVCVILNYVCDQAKMFIDEINSVQLAEFDYILSQLFQFQCFCCP